MHENLKSTFSLDSDKVNNNWQVMMSGYNYGTFYTISGKFEYQENTKIPIACDLHLQNYRGNVTLGIVDVHNEILIIEDPLHQTPTFLLIIHVKALYANNEFRKENLILQSEIDNPPTEFNSDCALKVEIIFEDADGFYIDNPEGSTFIDSSRGIREGEHIVIPDYSNRHDDNFDKYYKKYLSQKKNVSEEDIMITRFDINDKTIAYPKRIEDFYEYINVEINDVKSVHKMLYPPPCSSNYVRFI